ncbi:MAG: V-type ATP synthase subunit E [Nitrososphaerota archaeon]
MSIETFVHEIENRKKKDIESLDSELAKKKAAIQSSKNTSIKELQERHANEAKIKSEREEARIVEAGRLQAKKILFDAINTNLDSTFNVIKEELKNYTTTPQYKKVLETMIKAAKKRLDQNITVRGREEDRAILKKMNLTIGSSIQTLGGIIAENKNGTKELDLTFDELLRTHEDEIKNTILERIL